MTEKARVALERWVRGSGAADHRRIKCEFSASDKIWHIEVHTDESDVYIHVRNPDFHAAMDRALVLVREGQAHRRKYPRPTSNRGKRTSRRARRTSRRAR